MVGDAMIPRDADDEVPGAPAYPTTQLTRATRAAQLRATKSIAEVANGLGYLVVSVKGGAGKCYAVYTSAVDPERVGQFASLDELEAWLLSGCPEQRRCA